MTRSLRPKLPAHLQHGETHVDAVKVGNDVEQKQKRHQPPHESGDDGGFQAVGSSFQKWFQFQSVRIDVRSCSAVVPFCGARILRQAEPSAESRRRSAAACGRFRPSPLPPALPGRRTGWPESARRRSVRVASAGATRSASALPFRYTNRTSGPAASSSPVAAFQGGAGQHDIAIFSAIQRAIAARSRSSHGRRSSSLSAMPWRIFSTFDAG